MADRLAPGFDATDPTADAPLRVGGRRRPRLLLAGALALAVAAGLVWAATAGPLRSSQDIPAPSQAGMGTSTVTRTDIAERQQVAGTLGYAGSVTVVGQRVGTVTGVAAPGRVVGSGGELAEVDDAPVIVMLGQRPAWRAFTTGMTDGPDVRQLESNLRSLGFDPGHTMTVDNHFSSATAAVVRRWQHSLGVPQTGTVPLGSVAFLPTPIRVTDDQVLPGALTAPGQPLVSGTTTTHQVSVALDAGRQSLVHAGDQVVVTLPDGTTTTNGTVSFVSRVAAGGSAASGGDTGGQGGGAAPTVQVTVALSDQAAAGGLDQAPVQVSITDRLHRSVLAVPVTALVAVPGGGYAITRPDGTPAPVTVGLFDDLTQLVEVAGPGVTEGLRVQVPAS